MSEGLVFTNDINKEHYISNITNQRILILLNVCFLHIKTLVGNSGGLSVK